MTAYPQTGMNSTVLLLDVVNVWRCSEDPCVCVLQNAVDVVSALLVLKVKVKILIFLKCRKT